MIDRLIKLCLQTPLLVLIATGVVIVFGFNALQDNPKDAIPDISENQVIVSTEWMGRSPQDVEDQITYPLAQDMQGIPQVVDVRTISGFGFSRIYVVFQDGVDVYWARSRVLERIAVAGGKLPDGVKPALGPDATSLGQIFEYTVEGPYDLATLRSLQDYTVRYALQNADGVAEVATVGGYVREYQVEVNPDALRAHGITLEHVVMAVKQSNLDVGAKTIEQGGLEYLIRGVGFVKQIGDLEQIVLKNDGHVPVLLRDVARVQLGPEFRRGALADDKGERVGGIVTMRYGANPQEVIDNVKAEIDKLQPALPEGVEIKPFYDRTQLIDETLWTLTDTIIAEILVTMLVVIVFLLHLRSGLLISATIPLSVLLTFIAMEALGIPSNIMSLGGIIIAIGVVVDMAIIMTETIYRALQEDGGRSNRLQVIHGAAKEVGGAIVTSVLTIVISFVPIFFLPGQSYKLFAPLAWTKTFCLLASALIAITLVPVLCYLFLGGRPEPQSRRARMTRQGLRWVSAVGMASLFAWLTLHFDTWMESHVGIRASFVALLVFLLSGVAVLRMWNEKLTPIDESPIARGIVRSYQPTLMFFLRRKWILGIVYVAVVFLGALATFGARTTLAPLFGAFDAPDSVRPLAALDEHYPGFGHEFMPPLDEGSLLYMPSLLSQAGLGKTLEAMEWQNRQIASVPEVKDVVGKLGRAETSLDPAPIGMIETIVGLKPKEQWRKAIARDQLVERLETDMTLKELQREMREGNAKNDFNKAVADGLSTDELLQELRDAREVDDLEELFEDGKTAEFTLGEKVIFNLRKDLSKKELISDLRLKTFQPGVAPSWLQPIQTRVVMLSSGIRARIGLEIVGADANTLAELALKLEPIVKEVDGAADVTALRTGGKPYVEFELKRERMAHYGVSIQQVNTAIEIALGGKRLTTTVEGRERYPVRVRYERELRDNLEELGDVLITTPAGAQIPITEVADIRSVVGPAAIRGVNGQLVGYVMFNPVDIDETTLIEHVEARVNQAIESGEVEWPKGYSYRWVGQYKEAQRANKRLSIIIPVALGVIFLLVFLHFKRASTTLIVFSGVPLGAAGGALMVRYWPWMQHLLTGEPQGPPIYVTVAVVVGFIALLGVLVEDGVVIGTYIQQLYEKRKPQSRAEVRRIVIEAGSRRIRPSLMTTMTTIIALVPVLLTTGRGSDVMQPMALPVFGGMCIELLTLFVVPTAMSAWLEWRKTQ
ncbi:MAG: efflux RND transporter permease subunit [Planctomycetes bacterium]|nr:efflux RND transporter permease subunit [Planctomycetota bacterium]